MRKRKSTVPPVSNLHDLSLFLWQPAFSYLQPRFFFTPRSHPPEKPDDLPSDTPPHAHVPHYRHMYFWFRPQRCVLSFCCFFAVTDTDTLDPHTRQKKQANMLLLIPPAARCALLSVMSHRSRKCPISYVAPHDPYPQYLCSFTPE